jgi:hypothetical protein
MCQQLWNKERVVKIGKQGKWWGVSALAGCVMAGPAVAAGLSLVAGAVVYDADGFVRISGEIHNNTGQTVCRPQVDVFLKDAAGKPITVTSVLTETKKGLQQEPTDGTLSTRHWLPNGEVAVFTYLRELTKLGGAKPAKHVLAVSSRACEGALPKIAVEGFKDTVDSVGSHAVSGSLRNTGTVPCRSPKIVLGFYGADGTLIETNYVEPEAYFQKQLGPGKSVGFSRDSLASPDWRKPVKFSFKHWGDCASHEP